MNIVDRVKNILLTPKTEWDVIAAETTPTQQLIVGYVLPLAAIAAIAGFIGSFFLLGTFGFTGILIWGLVAMVVRIVMAVVAVFVVGFVIDALAPSFGGQKNQAQSLKVAAYSFTAGWVGGIFNIIPFIGWLVALLAALYGLYLLYLGLPKLMHNPEDKTIGYTVVVVLITIVVMVIVNILATCAAAPAYLGGAMLHSGAGGYATPSPKFAKDSTVGKLDDFAKKMEAASKKMEAAQASGDQKAQAQAALDALGTVVSGGRKVQPLSVDEVKAFVPETFAGLPRTSQSAERGGMDSLQVTTAKATYGDNSGKQVRLEVTDAGGAGAMMGLASWMGAMNMEREDDNGAERTRKEGNRLVHERVSKRGGDNEYSVVVGDRFIVKAAGTVDLGGLKGGVSNVNLAKLESMKDVGVAKN
jgi:hypothetical protein